MVKMETYFNTEEKWGNIKVQDCKREDNIPFEELTPPDILGAICFEVDGTVIMDHSDYDYIILLWLGITQELSASNMLSEKCVVRFPDTLLRLEFTPIMSDKVDISYYCPTKISVVADKKELLKEIIREGILFFTKIKELLPEETGSCDMNIEGLKVMDTFV